MTAYPGGRVASTAPSAAVHYGSARRGAAQKSFNTCRVSAAIPHYTFADGRRTRAHLDAVLLAGVRRVEDDYSDEQRGRS